MYHDYWTWNSEEVRCTLQGPSIHGASVFLTCTLNHEKWCSELVAFMSTQMNTIEDVEDPWPSEIVPTEPEPHSTNLAQGDE